MQRPEVPLQKKKNVNGWDQHKPFSENRVYKICIESLLFIYSKKVYFIEQMKIRNIGRTAYQQFKFMHSFWNHRGWGGAARANQSLYAYLLQHFAVLWYVILIICYGIFMQSYEICMLWYSMLCYALRFE